MRLVLLLLIVGCETPPALTADLIGGHWFAGRHAFDHGQHPAVLTARHGPVSARVQCRGQWRLAEVRRTEVLGGVRLELNPVDCHGDGGIEVSIAGSTRMWPVQWIRRPADRAAVQRFHQLIATEQIEEALAFAERAGPDTLWTSVERARWIARHEGPVAGSRGWREAAAVAEALDAPSEVARRLRAAAHFADRAGDLALARTLIDQAMRASDDLVGRARAGVLGGRLALASGAGRESAQILEAALDAARRLGDARTEAFVRYALAVRADAMGHGDEAINWLLSAHHAEADLARYASNLAWALIRQGENASVDALLTVALDAARDPALRADIIVNRVWLSFFEGRLDRATRLLQMDEQGHAETRTSATLVAAEVALARGDLVAATTHFTTAERLARAPVAGGDCEGGWRARFGQGRVLEARGNLIGALWHFEAAIAEVERLGARTGLRADRSRFFESRGALTRAAIDAWLAFGDPSTAFEVADAARARVLRAMQARARLDGLTDAQRMAWTRTVGAARKAQDALARESARGDLVADRAAWRARMRTLRRAEEEALAQAFEHLDTVAPLSDARPMSGADVRATLADDEALLALRRMDDRWLAFWVTADGIDVRWLDSGDPLGPWRARLASLGHLYIVPGGHPDAIQLHTQGTFSASYLPYAGALRPRIGQGRGALFIIDPRSDLPHTNRTGRTLAEAWKATLLRGTQATRDAVLAQIGTARHVHFAGHGVLNDADPWEAHLALADGGTLGLPEVLTRRVEAALVVLSGCETGPGKLLLRDDHLGLPEAFLAAGAARVIASDVVVPDAETAAFFERFYAEGGRERPAEALRRVTQALPVGAAFRLIGRR